MKCRVSARIPRTEFRVKLEMAYFVRDGKTLAIGVVKRIDANNRHAVLDKHETRELFIER